MLKDKLATDLKAAMIARDRQTVDVLKGLKSAILYEEVAKGAREQGLDDEAILAVIGREVKKRQESAELFIRGGNQEKATAELEEKAILEKYLPAQLSETEVDFAIDSLLREMGIETLTKQDMGKVIGALKQQMGAQVDGALLARLVQSRIPS